MDQRDGQREAMIRTLRLEDLCSTVRLVDCRGHLEERGRGAGRGPEEEVSEGERRWQWKTRDIRAEKLYWAVLTGDSMALRVLLKRHYVDVDVLYDIGREELEWRSRTVSNFGHSGLWSLEYKRELTSPLCIAAAQGYTECLRYLLEHGARPNLTAGGKTALHEACENDNSDCAELLLEHGASPALLSEDGYTPLHLCRTPQSLRCAKALVRHGAKVDVSSEDEGETPLHVAARHGLRLHAQLYLRYGAQVDARSASGETPLGAACTGAQGPPEEGEDEGAEDGHLPLCRMLLAYGANVNAADGERRTPLHRAARNVQRPLVELLLEHGADVNALDYNGATALSSALQNAVVKAPLRPHLVVQMLLNHGSIKMWPLALLKVLTNCAAAPKTVETLFNSYTQVIVTYKWLDAIPEEIVQAHEAFYESLFALECRPRCLQHLCRSALRKHFGKDCHRLVPRLPIPRPLQRYLLLEPEGFLC